MNRRELIKAACAALAAPFVLKEKAEAAHLPSVKPVKQ